MSATLLAVCTIAALLGLLVVVLGFLPQERARGERMPSVVLLRLVAYRSQFSRERQLLALAGLVVGILVWVITGWFVMLIAVPVAAIGVPLLLGTGNENDTIARLEALETWTRSLSGLIVAGAGLEQAVTASLSSTPSAIKPQVAMLTARINARWATAAALQGFADDLKDPTADLVVAHLLLADKQRGPGLVNALDDLAQIVFEEVRVRREIETDRAKPRTSVRIITLVTLALLLLIPFMGEFMAPYRSFLGQVALAVWLTLYVVLLIWLKRITVGTPTPRILENPLEAAPAAVRVTQGA
ncbi:pilus assembly protein TadB [Cryobacterium melibiosiphilum]|uniref:Pilus assembly protein TadB n=1 Tax=Cryobacterium melibiosiphilum TaxID=995039 RepID=A0A3A5M7N9_9MICO|nr:type II secretion system F family protein [Cryobacterium melibiosiphilum]RJT84745.1 pilus assembly protein TadB [Cryobacterium melibiosiphilum]